MAIDLILMLFWLKNACQTISKKKTVFTVILHDHYQNVGTVNQIASDIYGKINNSY